ncbi:ImmA/IrrE family metallo-endopeptidase [Pedobacter sp.]|jgi:hypothetical protein|uniref:ImmA/IrrE family metallo-endopeptidase n=1 Tax=Pedobacter sp. TaxID=1411316 RepID=UPI002C115FAC|nr:ImmA/IrrE family metallo-endopeptidase [Pedobacter sp.]HWW37735.1 ImmA/IrrE family metallo-endopeptidase [Pedobacter sp.]
MNHLVKKAIFKADEIRMKLGLNMFQPVNVFTACEKIGLTVRFVDINMEGIYVTSRNSSFPTILISNLRPFPRRYFTCAHELGHHVFGHGGKIDILTDNVDMMANREEDELLVDAFAGAFLMPVAGILAEFVKRNWTIKNATPLQFITISSVFGVGYQTLISHCRLNRIISDPHAQSLLNYKPNDILFKIFGGPVKNSFFKIIDDCAENPTIDLETSNYIFLPNDLKVEGNNLKQCQCTGAGIAYIAQRSGIVRVATKDGDEGSFIRIQNHGYIGLSENRHLENENE